MKNFQIAGHLGATPELKTSGETTFTHLRVCANGKRSDWFNVTAFGKLAEAITEHLAKGDGIAIHGEMRTKKYDGREYTELIAQGADFFGKKKDT